MKSITIHQPFATLIALGEKRFETRSWSTRYRGPIAIHAAKKVDKEICLEEPFRSVLAKHGYTAENLPVGAVVATSILAACYKTNPFGLSDYVQLVSDEATKSIDGNEFAFGDYSRGRYAWEMTEVQLLADPVPAKGQQGLWNWGGKQDASRT
ncbi:ASCH domain-containing protein [Brevibacillus brevis]|uniref:ASCH domain-containing protein n=1 Tax=Brevibacillus brevis TaxID=1393 RepID=UPI000D0F3817|nr:ASCH domain-containing protein [Brevibacillus brevis]PSJ58661.1 2-oxoglutarate dehydrogenase E1 [Brevibacillus brevis]